MGAEHHEMHCTTAEVGVGAKEVLTVTECCPLWAEQCDNFRMNTSYGRYGATYNMVGFCCFNEELPCVWVELSLLPKNPTEAKLQATSTRGESTEPTKGVMKHTYKAVLYNYCLMQYCCILLLSTCEQRRVQSKSMGKGIQIHGFQFNR
jgi:hypothetical protein